MSKIKTIMTGLGVVAGFAVSMAPLAAYADEVTNPNTVTAVLNDVISMSLESHSALGTKTLTCESQRDPACTGTEQVVSTTILPSADDKTSMYTIITVNTNVTAGFDLTMKDYDTNTNLQTTSNDTIATINSEPVGGSNPGWAVKIDNVNTWHAVPASNAVTPLTIKTHQPNPAAVSVNVQSRVTYGVAASSSQATGTYTDTIVYTATTRQ
jgi:hypothetical protein